MTQIPSHLPASAAQAGVQANEVAKEREARRTGQADVANRQIKSVDEAGSTVDTEDSDVAVFGDAEGAGGEGREPEKKEDATQSDEDDTAAVEGISRDEDGKLHVDLEA